MRTRHVLLSLLATTSLACGGMFVSDDDIAALSEGMKSVEPDQAVTLLVQGGAEIGLVNPVCAQCVEPYAMASADFRQVMGANALTEPSCLCPATCASDLLDEVATLAPRERMAALAQACDEEGPDPVFADALIALRPEVNAIDYAMVRMMMQPMEGTEALASLQEPLAVGLALHGGRLPDAAEELVVIGHSPEPIAALADQLIACEDGLEHRLVVRPDGTVAAMNGPACDALSDLVLPGEGWRLVDIAWSQEGISGQGGPDGGDDPDDPAPGGETDDTDAAPGSTPTPKTGSVAMKAGPPTVKGSLDAQVVSTVLRRHRNQLRYCYERTLTKKPGLEGKVVAKIVIATDGTVSSASVSEGIDKQVDNCVIGRFMRMRFPSPQGGGIATVTYPMTFSAD